MHAVSMVTVVIASWIVASSLPGRSAGRCCSSSGESSARGPGGGRREGGRMGEAV